VAGFGTTDVEPSGAAAT